MLKIPWKLHKNETPTDACEKKEHKVNERERKKPYWTRSGWSWDDDDDDDVRTAHPLVGSSFCKWETSSSPRSLEVYPTLKNTENRQGMPQKINAGTQLVDRQRQRESERERSKWTWAKWTWEFLVECPLSFRRVIAACIVLEVLWQICASFAFSFSSNNAKGNILIAQVSSSEFRSLRWMNECIPVNFGAWEEDLPGQLDQQGKARQGKCCLRNVGGTAQHTRDMPTGSNCKA